MKKNFRKMPTHIEAKLDQITDDKIIVASVLDVSESDIRSDKFSHLKINKISDLYTEKIILPKATSGRFSKINIRGMIKARKDLPKTLKTIDLGDRPNFGDWSRGSHNVSYNKPVYQKHKLVPRNLRIKITLLETTEVSEQKIFSIKFQIDKYLEKSDISFSEDLFFSLNLLNENIGTVDVFPITTTKNEFMKIIYVQWEIFPTGERDSLITRLLKSYRKPPENILEKINEKIDFFESLKPQNRILGLSRLKRYVGAQINDSLVVFENIDYGNAIFILFGNNWRELSQLTKSELRKRNQNEVIIVEHRYDWKEQVKKIVQEKR